MSANGPVVVTRPLTRIDKLRQDWGHLYEVEDRGDHVRAHRRESGAEWITAPGAGYLRKAIEADDAAMVRSAGNHGSQ